MLDPVWVRHNHASFDVMHIHFGFDAQTGDNLQALVESLAAHRKPLVYTVHDLRNPHHVNPQTHQEHLDVLIPAADELITLTPGAATTIARRWGKAARVLPHPHVVEIPGLARTRRVREQFVVGIHLKSLRANMEPLPVLEVLSKTVAGLPDAVLRVDVHTDVFEVGGRHYHPSLVAWLEDSQRRGVLQLEIHDFFSDAQLWTYLCDDIDVSVLPYRFGTHSGWLEACHDLGTMVVAPDCGFYTQQRPCFEYGHNDSGFDSASLAAAVQEAYERRPRWRATAAARQAERAQIATAHRALYSQVLR
jgi:hypothetical protein